MSFWPLEKNLADEIRGRSPAVELGGGDGQFARLLTRVGIQSILIDSDAGMLARAAPNGGRVLGDALRIPILDGRLQFLSCANLLRALPSRLREAAEECRRVLSPGARLLILEDDPSGRTEAERNYREALRLLAAADARRGGPLEAEEVAGPFRSVFGEPILSGRMLNELVVEEPLLPLRWLNARGVAADLRDRLDALEANVRRNGMAYGFYWFQLYGRSHDDRARMARSS